MFCIDLIVINFLLYYLPIKAARPHKGFLIIYIDTLAVGEIPVTGSNQMHGCIDKWHEKYSGLLPAVYQYYQETHQETAC